MSVESRDVGRRAIGIDIGSLYLKCVEIDERGAVAWRLRERHCGDVAPLLERCRERANGRDLPIGVISRGTVPSDLLAFDPVIGLTTGVRALCPDARNILEVGGSNLTLVHVGTDGRIISVHRNSLCAAGSGSFLDEQAARLNIDRDAARAPVADPPRIATRCAVFAKSDLVHRQQEGCSPESVWSGLCRGLADGVLRSLTYGRPLSGLTALCGGVARDPSFVWWFERCLKARSGNGRRPSLRVVPEPDLAVALGAALLAARTPASGSQASISGRAPAVTRQQRAPLSLVRSRYPEAAGAVRYVDEQGNEVTLHVPPRDFNSVIAPDPIFSGADVILGLDIGSTSTKCALVTPDGRMLLDVYRRTDGDPIGAIRKLLNVVIDVEKRYDLPLRVRAAATTGSGRKLAGKVFGADLVVNEISAHAAGAIHLEPSVETIFEIGGQDCKYMAVRDGRVIDANMNYVCAAGTGSFVEECAAKLGYRIEDVGDAVLGVSPPFTSSRCTVFMEQDVLALLRRGATRPEALGAVLYSVVENYLERVVGRRHVNTERLFFQGATARNRGLVAAIENLLNVEVVVSPYCHVMGAYGAALLARPALANERTRFRGLDLGSRAITLVPETCDLCVNRCRLTRAEIEGEAERPAWGMVCGRDEQDRKMRVPPEYALVRKRTRMATRPERADGSGQAPGAGSTDGDDKAPGRAVRIGLPLALSSFTLLPFWTSLFREIGMEVVPSEVTDHECLELAKQHAAPEMCLPLKAAHGHVARLAADPRVDAVFMPHLIADRPTPGIEGSKFCPYVETAPSLIANAMQNGSRLPKPVLSPVIDLTLSDRWNAEQLVEALRPLARLDRDSVQRALGSALHARDRHRDALVEMGRQAITRSSDAGKPAVVLIGRPYNTLDAGISLDVPYHIADCGFDVIPMDCLPFEAERLAGELRHMFWHYGQRILSAVARTARTDGLYGVYLTSFGCGPDSFLLSYAEAIMGDKPFLILELDEHGSNGGYQTRIEAFLDVIRSDFARRKRGAADPSRDVRTISSHEPERAPAADWLRDEHRDAVDWKTKTVWMGPMHDVGHRLFAATFRGHGIDARTLPPEDDEAYAIGKRVTRGSECLPCPLTIGGFLKQLEKEERAPGGARATSALFMPTTCGPCRFGQYRTLARLVLDRLGYQDVPILSPSQDSSSFDLDTEFRNRLWEAIVASDILFKMRCRVRPYEATAGDAEDMLETWTRRLEDACESGRARWKDAIAAASRDFARIPQRPRSCPLVGIVGEIYLRCNRYANGDLIETIERLGGEAWLAPIGEWIEYCTWADRFRSGRAGAGLLAWLQQSLTFHYMAGKARRMYRWALPLLHDRLEPEITEVVKAGSALLPPEFEGESILTLGRTILFAEQGADLVVNCAPFNCMQGNITTALFERLRATLGVPVVNVFYDGGEDNMSLVTFLSQAAERKRPPAPAASAYPPSRNTPQPC